MGTNFYLRKKITEAQLKAAHEALDKFANSEIYHSELDEIISGLHDDIHIGKRSSGWQFIWDYHNGKYYKANLKDIRRWLTEYTQTDWALIDEYGEEFTVEQFFDDEIKGFLHEGYTLKTYADEHPNESRYYNPDDCEFISDGQRFSTSEDFA